MSFLQKLGGVLTTPLRFGLSQKSGLAIGGVGRFGGRQSLFYGLLPGAKIDYQRIAGCLWKNSIVAASVHWIGRNLPQAPPCVFQMQGDGTEKIVPHHPLTVLLLRPNKYYSGRTLRWATILSLVVSGNAYWYIIRGMDGKPAQLWYLPHFQIRPVPGATTDDWITHYEYLQNGEKQPLKFADVIHFRDGLDPEYPWLGLSPLASAFRLVVTDNEADGYAAAILRNMGIPGAIITPKDASTRFDQPQADELKEQYEESTQGDNRGRPMVLSGPVDVKTLALSPEQLLLDTAQDKPEERISALIGIPVGVLQLGVGLEHGTYNNREADHEVAWTEGIIPRLDLINSEIDTQLLPFLGDPSTERTGSDYRGVKALQESADSLYVRLGSAVGGPFLTPNEARRQVGLTDISTGDVLYPPKAGGMQQEPNEPAPGTPAAAADPADTGSKKPGKGKKAFDMKDSPLTWADRVRSEIEAIDNAETDNSGTDNTGESEYANVEDHAL